MFWSLTLDDLLAPYTEIEREFNSMQKKFQNFFRCYDFVIRKQIITLSKKLVHPNINIPILINSPYHF